MEEDELKSLLSKLDAPEPRKGARERTKDGAWAKLDKNESRTKKRSGWLGFSSNAQLAVVCSLILAVGSVLSYGVTQSSRSGGGSVDGESNLVNSAQVTQYPASVRTAMVRMVIGGVEAEDLDFSPPEAFASLEEVRKAVFHPAGGGATYIQGALDIMANEQPGMWYFNAEFEISGIGQDVENSPEGNDIVAFLPGIKDDACTRINAELGIQGDTKLDRNFSSFYSKNMVAGYSIPAREVVLGDQNSQALSGQPFGCFQNNDGTFVYYHTLLER